MDGFQYRLLTDISVIDKKNILIIKLFAALSISLRFRWPRCVESDESAGPEWWTTGRRAARWTATAGTDSGQWTRPGNVGVFEKSPTVPVRRWRRSADGGDAFSSST